MGKYILHCDTDDLIRDDFIKVVTNYKRRYMIVYNPSGGRRQADGKYIITFNGAVFENMSEFLDHVEDTSGGYDGLFGYSRKATI